MGLSRVRAYEAVVAAYSQSAKIDESRQFDTIGDPSTSPMGRLYEVPVVVPQDVYNRTAKGLGVELWQHAGERPPRRKLFAEVHTFCPIPLPGWQRASKAVLTDLRTRWLKQLATLRRELTTTNRLAVTPFMRFWLEHETPDEWVTLDLDTLSLDPAGFLEDDEDREGGKKSVPSAPCTVPVLRRPYIVWPTAGMESLTHRAQVADGSVVNFERPSPKDQRLDPRNGSSKARPVL